MTNGQVEPPTAAKDLERTLLEFIRKHGIPG
jgi:hypothetical protein